MKIAAIDLFCGTGGLTRGLIDAGIPVIAGYDLEKTCRYAYETNNSSTFYCKDITTLTGAEIIHQYPNVIDFPELTIYYMPLYTTKVRR